MLQFLASEMQHGQYRGLLRSIGLKDNKLDDVEHKHPRNAEECRFQSLMAWKGTLGVRVATLRKLVHGMMDYSMRLHAESFCDKFGLNHLVQEYEQMHPELQEGMWQI